MEEAVGLSYLYPALPIMNVLSMVLCLLLTPGFWKTRIVALITLVVWIFLGNLITFIGMIQWRGNTNDVPILAGFFAVFWRMWPVGCFASTACFAHFTWQRLQPLPMRQLYDTRRRNNWIHFVVCVIVPVLWVPLSLLSFPRRYQIIEDFGPVMNVRSDWLGFMIVRVPLILSYLVGILFNTLALVTYWRMKREDIESDLLKDRSSVRTRKLLLQALFHILLAACGIFRSVHDWANLELVAPSSFAENFASLQYVIFSTRSDMTEEASTEEFINMVVSKFTIPLLGFYFFAWFGCGEEARKAYREACIKSVRLMGLAVKGHQPHVGSSPFPWSCITLRRPKMPQGMANYLPHIHPHAPQVTPYTSAVPRDNSSEPSASPAINNPSGLVGNVIDIKWLGRAPSREPPRRLSMHKPPTATLNPANAISSASDIPLHRLSYHKPPSVPSVLPSVPAIAGRDASGSVAPRVEGMDSARRQEKFALRPHPRRLSYHKPAFVSLARASDTSGVATASGPTVPLVEVARDLIGDRNARLQPEGALDIGLVLPPFSGPSTSTAPSPLSAVSTPLSARTPAPPYQYLNPFHDRVL